MEKRKRLAEAEALAGQGILIRFWGRAKKFFTDLIS